MDDHAALDPVVAAVDRVGFRRLLVEHDPVELEQVERVTAVASPGPDELRPQRPSRVREVLGDRGEIELFLVVAARAQASRSAP